MTNSDPPAAGCCAWACRYCHRSSLPGWQRCVKRKLDVMAAEEESRSLTIQALNLATPPPSVDVLAHVEVENECQALRETVSSQQQTIVDLYEELDEERNASSTATSEAMSMILRIQREKAEVQMEARQFKRFAEERMDHDQLQIAVLEDCLYKREQEIEELSCQLQAYRHRLSSYGIDPEPVAADDNDGRDPPLYEYPPLRCDIPEIGVSDGIEDPTGTPRTPASSNREHLQHIEKRIFEMERSPGSSHVNVLEKGVVVGDSPSGSRHSRNLSTESSESFLTRELLQDDGGLGKQQEEFPVMVDRASDADGDDMSDRVYTIDAVHGVAPPPPNSGVCNGTQRDSGVREDAVGEESDIKKLYMRLQALETDRESMRQAIISMRTDNAQLVLLREIAQNLSKGVVQPAPTAERRLVKKPSFLGSFSFISLFKWIVSFIFWKKKASHSKYMSGLSNKNIGLLLLLDKPPRMQQWRCLSRP